MEKKWETQKNQKCLEDRVDRERLKLEPINWTRTLHWFKIIQHRQNYLYLLGFNFCELLSSPTDLRGFSSRKFLSNCNDLTFFPKYPAILMVKYKRTISLKTEERKFVLIQRTRSSSVSYCFHGTLILLICGKVNFFFGYEREIF